MSLEAWGDDGMDVPDGYVTEERAEEMVKEALQERANQLREMVLKGCSVPPELRLVPYASMLPLADWLDPPNAAVQPTANREAGKP